MIAIRPRRSSEYSSAMSLANVVAASRPWQRDSDSAMHPSFVTGTTLCESLEKDTKPNRKRKLGEEESDAHVNGVVWKRNRQEKVVHCDDVAKTAEVGMDVDVPPQRYVATIDLISISPIRRPHASSK